MNNIQLENFSFHDTKYQEQVKEITTQSTCNVIGNDSYFNVTADSASFQQCLSDQSNPFFQDFLVNGLSVRLQKALDNLKQIGYYNKLLQASGYAFSDLFFDNDCCKGDQTFNKLCMFCSESFSYLDSYLH